MCDQLDSGACAGWLKRTAVSIAFGAAAALAATTPVLAEQASESASRFVEEVVVTARKREEELQDVPLSITAFNGDTIERMYGDNLSEFAKYTPNVQLARQPYAGNALFGGMRGIVFGDLEKSFDPAVGVVVDGVALVNNTGALIDTFDLEAVEILRGPQGTLFGRNTIAGVVNARRSRPTGEFGLKTQIRYGSHQETDFKGVLNFAATDSLAVKLGVFLDKGDGFQERADFDVATGDLRGTGDDVDGEDTLNVYTSVLWNPTENFEALFTYEYTDDESTLATPVNLTAPAIRPQWDAITGAMFAGLGAGNPAAVGIAIGTTLASGGNFCDLYGTVVAPLNSYTREIGCNTFGSVLGETTGYRYSITAQDFINTIESKAYTLELNYDLADLTFTAITSYRESDELLDEDNLGAPVEIFNPYRPQSSDQFSTELRVASNYGGRFEFVAGLYYLDSTYEISQSVWALGALSGNRESGMAPPSPDGDAGQDITAYAVFGEMYFNLTEKTRLTLGGRFTDETKDFFIFQRTSGDASGVLPPGAWGCGNLSASQQAAADAAAAGWIAMAPDETMAAIRRAALVCQDDGEENWTEFTPRVSLDYQFNPDLMGYASYSRGFRSGGFNGRATTPGSMGPYDPENVDSYEIGFRSTLMDSRLQANLTFFRSEYDDKHESNIYAFGVATETVVDNAASAIINGLEFEARYLAADNIQLRTAIGYVDGEYDEFLRPADPSNRNGPQADLSDTFEFAFAPEITASIGIDAYYALGDYGELHFTGNLAWADETVGNFGLPDPQGLGRNEFEARETLDLALTWHNRWVDVAVYGKNLTEGDNYLATSVDVGVFFFGAVRPGRSYGIELTKSW